ncbi:MAG: hypothetical protein JO262_09135 [Solirubrobacterales bacterium]|nr:hypothetical protein [Solirubrobacterales bacterium]
MATEVEIGRALAAVAATLNDQKLEHFDTSRVQDIVTEALGGEQLLSVDDGGGLHDLAGTRVGVVRRTPSGEWITERQNETAERADAAIPREPEHTGLKGLLAKLKG